MSNVMKEMLISFGFKVDDSSKSRAEAAVKGVEERITAQNIAQAAKRIEADRLANVAKVAAAAAAGKELTDGEKRLITEQDERNRKAAERQEKLHRETAEREAKLQTEEAKKSRDRREASFKQLSDFTLRAAALATKVVAGIEAVAGGILFTADRAAAGLERLNYAAQSSGSSVKGMNAFAYAIAQNGGSADAAQASLKRFGDQLQKFPAYEQLLKSMGVATRDMNGEMRKTEDIATDFMGHLGKQNRVTREALGEKLGFDEATVQAGIRPGLREGEAQYNRDQAALGNDPNANATKGTAFSRSARHLREQIGGMGERVEGNMFEQLKPQLDDLSKWIDAHGDHVAEILSRIASDIMKLARAVLSNLAKVDWDSVLTKVENFAKDFEKTATKYFGEKGTLALPFIAFGAMLTGKVLGPINAIVAGLGVLGKIPGLAALLGNPAVLGTAAVGAVLASGDPNKALIDGGRPDVQPQDNDLGLPGTGDPNENRTSDTSRPRGIWDWIKANAMPDFGKAVESLKAFGKATGFGDKLPEDRRVRDAIIGTEKAVNELKEVVKQQQDRAGGEGEGGGGGGGVLGVARRILRNAGAAAGAGFGGSSSRPAKGPLAANQKEAYAAALKEGLSPTAARALVANMSGEGLAVPHDYHWDGTHMAQGIVQWDPTRSARIAAQFGKQPKDMTVAEQTKAAIWEMQTRPEYGATARALKGDNGPAMIDALVDNYERPGNRGRAKAQRYGYYRGFNPDAPATAATASAPSPVGTSAKAVTDAEVFAARQRLTAGGTSAADRALDQRYRTEQAIPLASRHPAPIGDVGRLDRARASDAPLKVEVTKAPLDVAHQKLADAMNAEADRRHKFNQMIVNLHKEGRLDATHLYGRSHHALGDTEAMRRAVHHSIKGDTNLNHSQVFNIQGGDVKQNMEAARLTANRGQQDILRNIQVLES